MKNLSVNQKRIMSFVLAFFVTLIFGFSIIGITVKADTGEYREKNGVMYRVVNTLDEIKKAEPVYYNGKYYDTVINVSYEHYKADWAEQKGEFYSVNGLILDNEVNFARVEEDIVITEFNQNIQVYKLTLYYKDGSSNGLTLSNPNVKRKDGSNVDTLRSKNFRFGFSTVDIFDIDDNNIRPFDVNRDLNVSYTEDEENYIFTIETTQEAEYYCYIMAFELQADNVTHGRKIFDYESFVTSRNKEHYITLGLQEIINVLHTQDIPEAFDTSLVDVKGWRYKFLYALQKKMQLYDSNFPDIDSYYFTLKEDLSVQEFEYGCRCFIDIYNNWYLFNRPKNVKDKFNKLHMFTVYNSANDFFDIKIPFDTRERNFRSATGKLRGNQVISIPKTWYNTVFGKPYNHTVLISSKEQAMSNSEDIKYFNFRFEGLGYDGSANPANNPDYINTVLDENGNPTDFIIRDHKQANADDKAQVNDNDLFGDGSFTGITNGAFNWIKGFINIFPTEVQTIITLSLVIILAIGLIRLVIG